MTKKPNLLRSFSRSFLVAASFAAFVTLGQAKDSNAAQSNISLTEGEMGDECVMVFAKVGEAFECSIESNPSESLADCSVGIGGSGERCQLPRGIEFDRGTGAIKGIPQKAGFHEFVVLLTDKGVTRERVFLIDIEDSGVNPMKDAYASMFFGAAR